ncbi:hypothetical protein [Nannocystis pusilla]|uniref:Lipoprotein n=1 Tax=Nannocystis pusilla TaxID=889268 RepID=A0ABS7TLM4_9BACT|nr:hypothetical protein [Nannocystis pusilla]MBZ5709113.1 hypothetical protein [Nannocystis pusilla]
MSLPRFTYSSLRLLFVPAALALSACPFPKVLGDGPAAADTDTDTSSGTMPTTGDEPPRVCDNPAYACSQPPDCEYWKCGALGSPFDADGCLRQNCEDTPCAADEICYGVGNTNDCPIGPEGCTEDPQTATCTCELASNCSTGHCIPADEGPPVECPLITDEAECKAECSEWYPGIGFWRVDENDECVQDEAAPRCLWFPGDAWGGTATPGSFYEKATGLATMFGTDWFVPPHGWGDCGDADAPPACKCVGFCSQQQGFVAEVLENDLPCDDVSDCVLADAVCFSENTCGSVGVHKDNVDTWNGAHSDLQALGCCEGADPCGATLACEDQRCVALFP